MDKTLELFNDLTSRLPLWHYKGDSISVLDRKQLNDIEKTT